MKFVLTDVSCSVTNADPSLFKKEGMNPFKQLPDLDELFDTGYLVLTVIIVLVRVLT